MKASSLGFKEILIEYEMFGYEIACIVGPLKNVPKYVAHYHHREPPSLEELKTGYGWTFYSSGRAPIVWIPRFPKNPREYGTLAHEVAHAVTAMLDWKGVPIKANCDETFCNALGYGVTKILEAKRGR